MIPKTEYKKKPFSSNTRLTISSPFTLFIFWTHETPLKITFLSAHSFPFTSASKYLVTQTHPYIQLGPSFGIKKNWKLSILYLAWSLSLYFERFKFAKSFDWTDYLFRLHNSFLNNEIIILPSASSLEKQKTLLVRVGVRREVLLNNLFSESVYLLGHFRTVYSGSRYGQWCVISTGGGMSLDPLDNIPGQCHCAYITRPSLFLFAHQPNRHSTSACSGHPIYHVVCNAPHLGREDPTVAQRRAEVTDHKTLLPNRGMAMCRAPALMCRTTIQVSPSSPQKALLSTV